MAAPRRVIELVFSDENLAELTRVARSRTAPAGRVERAQMLLEYRETPSFYAVGRALGVTHQTVERCMRRAERLGLMAALDDSPILAAHEVKPHKVRYYLERRDPDFEAKNVDALAALKAQREGERVGKIAWVRWREVAGGIGHAFTIAQSRERLRGQTSQPARPAAEA